MQMANAQLAKQAGHLDAEPHLPTAVGAVIEAEAQMMAARGERDQAVVYLRNQLKLYYATSIRARLQKNINLMSLEGKPLPPNRDRHVSGTQAAFGRRTPRQAGATDLLGALVRRLSGRGSDT